MKLRISFLIFFLIILNNFLFAESVEKTILPNGLVVLTKENHTSRIVAVEIFIKTGPLYENEKNSGITNFIQSLLLKGTKKRNAEEIAYAVESLGGIIDISISPDYSSIYLIISSPFLVEGLEILTDVLLNPKFDEEEIEKTRKEILSEIKKEEDELFNKVYKLFSKKLYKKHPYGKTGIGEEETIKNITREEILKFYNDFYVPNNMVISAVGDFKKEELLKELEKYFAHFPSKEIPRMDVSDEVNLETPEEISEKKDTSASWVMLGFPVAGIRIKEDYAALKLLDSLAGSGMSSLLFVNLRDKLGLAYEIGSFYPSRLSTSHFVVYAITSSKIPRIKSAFLFETSRIKYINFSEEELERAKKYLIGTFILDHEENKKQAFYLGFYEVLGLGYNFDKEYTEEIKKVKLQDIKRVAQKYFNNYVFAIVGKSENSEE